MQLLYALESIRMPWLDAVMSLITNLGGETVFMALAIIVFWCVNKACGCFMLMVGFSGTVINQFLKLAFRIPRPWIRDPNFTIVESARDAAGYSFPSGHTQNVFASFGVGFAWAKKTWLKILCAALLVLTAFSRMYLGVHTPADVGVSCVIGLILVIAFYPLFRDLDQNPKRMYWILLGMVALDLAFLLYAQLWPFPADVDPENLMEGRKNAWLLLGALIGFIGGYAVDQKYVRFDPKAVWWVQIVKVVLGLVIILAIRAGVKMLLGGSYGVTCLRYGLMTFFAAGIWPMTFSWFAKLGKTKAQISAEK